MGTEGCETSSLFDCRILPSRSEFIREATCQAARTLLYYFFCFKIHFFDPLYPAERLAYTHGPLAFGAVGKGAAFVLFSHSMTHDTSGRPYPNTSRTGRRGQEHRGAYGGGPRRIGLLCILLIEWVGWTEREEWRGFLFSFAIPHQSVSQSEREQASRRSSKKSGSIWEPRRQSER